MKIPFEWRWLLLFLLVITSFLDTEGKRGGGGRGGGRGRSRKFNRHWIRGGRGSRSRTTPVPKPTIDVLTAMKSVDSVEHPPYLKQWM
ncbi:hypothetical protein TNCT_675071 [Trichonephila clavata]|uniref:Uncharacterized protein n=1 Tax=Trichonephila clavata TaxID=2740835 RepID=A0A8X6M6I2_TRICU|nr:hypothetical protein TNCT_675071 [Trichonephila clavata]